ncbi:MAG: hypothetical protein U1E70_14420 [Acetobacteraceae bacterium]
MSSMEAERVLTGSAALLAVMVDPARPACWPGPLCSATRLRPVAHVRLLFQRLRAIHHDWQRACPISPAAAALQVRPGQRRRRPV